MPLLIHQRLVIASPRYRRVTLQRGRSSRPSWSLNDTIPIPISGTAVAGTRIPIFLRPRQSIDRVTWNRSSEIYYRANGSRSAKRYLIPFPKRNFTMCNWRLLQYQHSLISCRVEIRGPMIVKRAMLSVTLLYFLVATKSNPRSFAVHRRKTIGKDRRQLPRKHRAVNSNTKKRDSVYRTVNFQRYSTTFQRARWIRRE